MISITDYKENLMFPHYFNIADVHIFGYIFENPAIFYFSTAVQLPTWSVTPYFQEVCAGSRDVYNRLDHLKAITTAIYGRISKIDSTKMITKKLQGVEANTASWVTNIGNEKGEVLNSIVTTSDSMPSLQVSVEGIINRFSKADVPPPVLHYTNRE